MITKRYTPEIVVPVRDVEEQKLLEDTLRTLGVAYTYRGHNAGVYCIWCGAPLDIVKDMKVYNDGRIAWYIKHCGKEYAVVHRAELDTLGDLYPTHRGAYPSES
jgi:hypothetical protein